MPNGTYVGSIDNDEYAKCFAAILSQFEHLESHMPRVLAKLIGIPDLSSRSPAAYIYRSLRNANIKIDVLRSLLEKSPNNLKTDEKFDESLSAYDTIRKKRNNYAHGLWWTNQDDKSVFLAIADDHGVGFFQAKPIPLSDLEDTVIEIQDLIIRVLLEI